MGASPSFRTIEDAAASGYTSIDYAGSLDEWLDVVARSMAERYMRGDQSMLDNLVGATGPIGQPNRADFGTWKDGKNGEISAQTYKFFYDYAKAYGATDPWIRQQFGPPPTRSATYQPVGLTREDLLSEAEKDRQNRLEQERIRGQYEVEAAGIYAGATIRAAEIGAQAQIQSTMIRAQTDWAIAQLDNLTRKYIAEGEWALQRELAYMQEQGIMTRFMLELGLKERALAQDAIAERNRHHEAMLALITEIAKYDAQLAAEPRNWIAYAAWLQNRGEVVNGMTLAAAAQAVPESMISPQELVNTPAGQSLAGGIVVQNILIAGQNGMQINGTSINFGGPYGGAPPQWNPPQWNPPQFNLPWNTQGGQQAGGQQAGGSQYPYSYYGINLSSDDYTGIANQILGLSGNQPYTQQQLQTTYESVNPAGPNVSTEGYYAGPRTNRLGMTVNPLGHKNPFRDFMNLLPSQREMNIGAASSVGRPDQDYLAEFAKSLPRGKARGAAAYG